MVVTKRRYTFEQWQAVPDDGRRYELLNGEPVEMAAPTNNHPDAREVRQFAQTGGGFREEPTRRSGHVLSSPLFPGIALPVADLFAVMRAPEP